MDKNSPDFLEESQYLERTKEVLSQALKNEQASIELQDESLIEAKKEWRENTHFGKYLDANQYMESIQVKASTQYATANRIRQYADSLQSPYFARVDFKETGYPCEKIYIGLHSVADEASYDTLVYDWRAPISSIFYRYELGAAQYSAPAGIISGEITKKRQYEIKNGELRYFFDSSINIQDEILRDVLSQNASPTMKNIVETIQREQDEIIRDTAHEVLMVQGVAGSGKTSVALHRIAYLMYQGLKDTLSAQNIIVLSPNTLFGRYIANVLPELGEESIQSITFEEIFHKSLSWDGTLESKNDYIELLTSPISEEEKHKHRSGAAFFTSPVFCSIIERYHEYVKGNIPFEDLCYNDQVLISKEEMRDFLYSSNRTLPTEKSLQLVSSRIWDAIHQERKKRLEYFVALYRPTNEHRYDYRTYARYKSIKEITELKHQIQKFTTLDYSSLFLELLKNKPLFLQMADGLKLPDDWEEYVNAAAKAMSEGHLGYGVSLSLLYLKNRFSGNSFPAIRQVVVDEAQDYDPLHFHLLASLFPNARFTILGDVNQTIEKEVSSHFYEETAKALGRDSSLLLTMNKGFRCSWEINKFSEQFLETPFPVESFDRHGPQPQIHNASSQKDLVKQLAASIHSCKQDGFSSIAVICKTMERANQLQQKLAPYVECKVISDHSNTISGVSILPLYLAKGLEFDAVMIDEANAENYHTNFDKKLLYVCSTRPLHRLELFYTGTLSPLISE